MNPNDHKCVLIIDDALGSGITANVASVLSITIGEKIKGLVGPDILDKQGEIHPGLTQLPIPVLGASANNLKAIRQNFLAGKTEESFLADFSSFAQAARTYEEYSASLQSAEEDEIVYLGIVILADKKTINKATKGLSLIGQ